MVDQGHPPDGERIGPYRVEGPLGSGGMGEVVVAYDDRLDRRVAIKRIRRRDDLDEDDRERFRREARAVAALSHPAIVQIHDVLSGDDGDAIVMELVEGRSLADKLASGPLPLPEAVRLGRQVAEGLAEAHRAHLVHRDLKAENVVVTPPDGSHPGRAKILDFGLAKKLRLGEGDESLTRKGALVGTVRAMAPEQAEGREVTPRSDLFSLGVLLYEMVTGTSPFRGSTPIATLKRVLTATARPVHELRPETPAALADLIAALLAKEPGRRPESAAEVARSLQEIGTRDVTAEGVGRRDAETPRRATLETTDPFGDQPTATLAAAAAPTRRESSAGGPVRRRWTGPLAALGLAVILAGVGWVGGGRGGQAVRVLVPPPVIAAAEPTDELARIAHAVRVSALAVLADLEGVGPVDPADLTGTSGSAVVVARAVAADEVLVASVEPRDAGAEIFLRRLRAADGETLWAESFDVALDPTRSRLLAEAIAVRLRRAYPRHPPRPGVPRLEARDGDFAELLEITRRIDSGASPLPPELERLEALARHAPRFLAAQLRAAAVALALHSDTRDAAYLPCAGESLTRARALAPEEPTVLELEIQLALARGEPDAARDALSGLEALEPGGVRVLFGRFQLARQAGDLAAAEAAMEKVVARRPSWKNLYLLADLERRQGDTGGARRHLEELLRLAPRNTWGLGKLTQLELLHGDLERAEALAERAIAIRPHRSYYNNLGLARFYLGRYEAALESYRQALDLDPGNVTARLNLADAELTLGHVDAARAGYREIAGELDGRRLEATRSMTLAQCLARLGETQRAVSITLETLKRHPDHAEVAYQAALVYSLAGETASAWANVEQALARGVRPRQFRIPAFDALRTHPRFDALIGDG